MQLLSPPPPLALWPAFCCLAHTAPDPRLSSPPLPHAHGGDRTAPFLRAPPRAPPCPDWVASLVYLLTLADELLTLMYAISAAKTDALLAALSTDALAAVLGPVCWACIEHWSLPTNRAVPCGAGRAGWHPIRGLLLSELTPSSLLWRLRAGRTRPLQKQRRCICPLVTTA